MSYSHLNHHIITIEHQVVTKNVFVNPTYDTQHTQNNQPNHNKNYKNHKNYKNNKNNKNNNHLSNYQNSNNHLNTYHNNNTHSQTHNNITSSNQNNHHYHKNNKNYNNQNHYSKLNHQSMIKYDDEPVYTCPPYESDNIYNSMIKKQNEVSNNITISLPYSPYGYLITKLN